MSSGSGCSSLASSSSPSPDAGTAGAPGERSSTAGTITDVDLAPRKCSVGTSAAEDSRDRLEQDPEVAAEREVLHVIELDREALGERERPAPKDLHRAGDPRLDGEPEAVLRAVAMDQLDLLWPWADDAHVALQHVHELRQLIEAEPSQYAPDARNARIALELEHRLRQLIQPDELL